MIITCKCGNTEWSVVNHGTTIGCATEFDEDKDPINEVRQEEDWDSTEISCMSCDAPLPGTEVDEGEEGEE